MTGPSVPRPVDLTSRAVRLLRESRGLLVTLGTLVTVDLLSRTPLAIPSPVAVYIVAVAYAAFSGGLASGLLSALLSFLYALYFLAAPGWPPHYTQENTRRLVVLALVAPTIAAMVGILKRRAEMFVQATTETRALERFRDLVEDLGAILWEADAVSRAFTLVSRRAEEILGYPIARWLEVPDFWIQLIHPEDRERVTTLTRTAAAEGRDHESEYRAVRADGEVLWVRDIVRVVRGDAGRAGQLRGVMIDVTRAKRMEEALRDSEGRYRLLFEGNPQPMYVYDIATHGFVAVNDAAVRAYGYTREEFLSMTLLDIRPAEDRAAFLKTSRETPPGFHAPGIWRHRKKDGTVFNVEITYHTLSFQGRPARLALAVDVTERRKAEARLKTINERFLSFGADANENIGRLTALLGELLGAARAVYARSEPGGLAFVGGWGAPRDPEPVDRPEERVCQDALARPGGELVVSRSDPGTSDAAAASGAATGGVVTYVARAVRGADGVAGALCLVFERNFIPGAGDEEIVGIVASALGVEEQRNRAEEARAALSEQRREVEQSEKAGGRAAGPPTLTTPGGTETILLVEDEEVVRSLAREILEIHGYTVLEASNGVDALKIGEAHAGPIHLILTEVVMPQMGGPDLEERVARLRPETRVVFMSGYTANAIVSQGVLRAGALYLQKPFTIEHLARKVREALDAPAGGPR